MKSDPSEDGLPACGAFTGFKPAGFSFLRALADNQSRAWFVANKHSYDTTLLAPMQALVAALSDELAHRDIPLRGDARRSIFRINRDVRFARDKSPYKTNMGAVLTRDGGKMSPGVLYIHIDPLGCFAACGFYHPEPASLQAIREAIAGEPDGFRHVIGALGKHSLALAPDEDALKRAPRGYEAVTDPEAAAALRHRSFTVRRNLPMRSVAAAGLVRTLADFAGDALPLLRFGWAAIDG
jgi:uncharacterized protein (TIGR02453 family)